MPMGGHRGVGQNLEVDCKAQLGGLLDTHSHGAQTPQHQLQGVKEGEFTQIMKIHSLSTHPYADGVGEVFESTKHFCGLRAKLCWCRIQVNSDSFFRHNKTEETQHASVYCTCGVIQVIYTVSLS